MSRYASWDLVVGRYPASKTAIDKTYGDSYFITGAEDEIDGYLAVRYSVPFSPVPGVVRDLTVDLAYWKLIYAEKRAKPLRDSIDARIKGIIDGTLLIVSSGAVLPQTGLETGLVNDHPSSFGPDSDLNWQPSQSWADEFQADRDADSTDG
jgi:phage gp36-like protein